ncbi:hypothetical protein BB558_002938 [Smittium angustum]|uniref:Integrase zinc-binding domain-containing protein n=1 Tax=Smittium angustum TaxID=133377 RepID=A0A2U1J7A7_SMIAN|nr:hypothetical protein BB558_002938 [Smittium angustum]
MQNAISNIEKSKETSKEYFDNRKRIRKEKLTLGDKVLLQNTSRFKGVQEKLNNRWRGPYVIFKVNDNGSFRLRELNGVELANPDPENRLKKFGRGKLWKSMRIATMFEVTETNIIVKRC